MSKSVEGLGSVQESVNSGLGLTAGDCALKSEIERLKKSNRLMDGMINDMIVANQAAYIEWRHGRGAKAAMQWVENGLAGPGHIPGRETSKYYKNAQLYFNEQKSDPFPVCPCGNPSSMLSMGHGYCCEEHMAMHKEKLDDDAKVSELMANGEEERALDIIAEAGKLLDSVAVPARLLGGRSDV